MLSKWSIRVKYLVGLGMLLVLVGILFSAGLYATYSYRNLVKSLSWRSVELPLAAELSSSVADLRIVLGELRGLRSASFPAPYPEELPMRMRLVRVDFRDKLIAVEETLLAYRGQLENQRRAGSQIDDTEKEWQTVHKIEAALCRVRKANHDENWMLDDLEEGRLDEELQHLQQLADELPSYLHTRLEGFAQEVQGQYRTLIVVMWMATVVAILILALCARLFYRWVFVPLRILVHASREVACGRFDHHIHLETHDEMAELAEAMNDMTARFRETRDDLDREVRDRTKQVVRSEQLASVGFLAAGVAHEINNPLAAIAMCAESLDERINEGLVENDADHRILAAYLKMIQDEAFRCKEITEKLLDFSRLGRIQREKTELGDLLHAVIDMVRHVGRYQKRHIELAPVEPVFAPISPQQIKQVVLNLLVNALDSLDEGGTVWISLQKRWEYAEIVITDNGCGMDSNVLEHVFEPFFTRRRSGQGTGLGLSISYRIVSDHHGEIEVESPGRGRGSTFRVLLPLFEKSNEVEQPRAA